MKKIFVAIISIIFSSSLVAEQFACQQVDNTKTTHVYFANGVNTSEDEAKENAKRLLYAYTRKSTPTIIEEFPSQNFKFLYAYNESRGLMKDLLETINQKVDETGGLTAGEILNLIDLSTDALSIAIKELSTATGGGRIVVNIAVDAVNKAGDVYIDYLKEDAAGASKYYENITSQDYIQKFTADLLEGKRVILVAHSQGNLFANKAVEEIIRRNPEFADNIGIVGVANPAGRIANGNPYVTAHDDRVIDALRITHEVLPSTIDNDLTFEFQGGDKRGLLNHNFAWGYLASKINTNGDYANSTLPSRAKIDEMFLDHYRNLEFPVSELGDGAIKVTLTWGAEPDVDLHIFEPNNEHVYYRNLRGTSGFLDLDDRNGLGPEHYFVACDKLEEGIYRVGVNYFKGTRPETANVQITTSDGRTTTVRKTLTNAVGGSGNNTPMPVVDIDVNRDENGKYTFRHIITL